jgi:hypothetical protein
MPIRFTLAAVPQSPANLSLKDEIAELLEGNTGAVLGWVSITLFLLLIVVIVGRPLARLRVRPGAQELEDDYPRVEAVIELDPSQYGILTDVYVPRWDDSRRLSRISHVVVCRQGVFVIEVKDYRGNIFGGAEEEYWSRERDRRVRKFKNPLRQSERHIRALAAFLKLPQAMFHPVVAFGPEADLRPPVPPHVIMTHEITARIESENAVLLDEKEVTRVWHLLKDRHDRVNRRTVAPRGVDQARDEFRRGAR